MVKASKGILITCDANVRALIQIIDRDDGGGYIIEDLSDTALFVKESRVAELKMRVKEITKKTVREPEDSDDEPHQL